MEFGRVEHPGNVDFTLPDEPESNRLVLTSTPAEAPFSLYFGTSQWNDSAYLGTLYPQQAKKGQELSWYAKQFNTIEFNPTFYAIPDFKNISNWRTMVGDGFQFCCKVPKEISHATSFSSVSGRMIDFLSVINEFQSAAGPVFLQLPSHFPVQKADRVVKFIAQFAGQHRFFLEVRHESWFGSHGIPAEIVRELQSAQIGLVISDVAGRRDVAHMVLTIPEVMIRWVGNMGHSTDQKRLTEWVDRLQKWKERGMKKIWFFLHQPEPGFVAQSAPWFSSLLRARGFQVPQVQLMPKQGGLFG